MLNLGHKIYHKNHILNQLASYVIKMREISDQLRDCMRYAKLQQTSSYRRLSYSIYLTVVEPEVCKQLYQLYLCSSSTALATQLATHDKFQLAKSYTIIALSFSLSVQTCHLNCIMTQVKNIHQLYDLIFNHQACFKIRAINFGCSNFYYNPQTPRRRYVPTYLYNSQQLSVYHIDCIQLRLPCSNEISKLYRYKTIATYPVCLSKKQPSYVGVIGVDTDRNYFIIVSIDTYTCMYYRELYIASYIIYGNAWIISW